MEYLLGPLAFQVITEAFPTFYDPFYVKNAWHEERI